jgi:glycosyltransferase involved in cell wall biosynthesis
MTDHSLILTVHNKDFLIERVLSGIKNNTTGSYELIVVLDGCTDNSSHLVDAFVKSNTNIKTVVIETPDVFETKANNAGLKLAQSSNVIIIQDDMVIREYGWNERITKPLKVYDDVFSVTSRTSHNWAINSTSRHLNEKTIPGGIWSDILLHVEHADRRNTSRDTFSIRDTSNRGPLAINHEDLKTLNYFDEIYSPQDMDEHDLHFRAKKLLGKITGVYWIDYISDDAWGGTRKTGTTAQWMLNSNHKNSQIFYDRYKDLIKGGNIQDRRL